jgi:hypothetical protein
MPENLFLPTEIQTTKTELLGYTLKELSILRSDATSPGVLAIVLAPLDEQGKWRNDIPPRLVRKVDDLDSASPAERYAASIFQKLVFTAVCSNSPENQSIGVSGMSIWDAAKVILAQEITE